MSRNQKIRPLMYIVQPEYKEITPQMQELVIKKAGTKQESLPFVPSELEETETNDELQMNKPVESVIETADNEIQEDNKDEKMEPKRKVRKRISQMSIQEKIEFFTTLPKNMPKSLCLIETTDGSYRGIIMSEEEGIVTIRTLNHPKPLDIQLENILAINVIGL
ncbi:CotO family spore coat protein [Metabacillus sp. Hm71]|uniref:CotO family spore coat protein n=1 Tax=Metabacillus sp. Hm71 TaxID=3450743 RepID=UPI003F422BA7